MRGVTAVGVGSDEGVMGSATVRTAAWNVRGGGRGALGARAATWEDGMSGKMRSSNLSVGDLLAKVEGEKERPSQGDGRDEDAVAAGAAAWEDGKSAKK